MRKTQSSQSKLVNTLEVIGISKLKLIRFVVFNQIRIQTLNPEYLKGRTSLNKTDLNILENYKKTCCSERQKGTFHKKPSGDDDEYR